MSEVDSPNILTSPKRSEEIEVGNNRFYPFYAGYSNAFVMDLLDYFSLDFDSIILDPWNGSGTTTEISSGLGYDSVGFDLNPVMLIVARARNVTYQQYDELYEMNRSLHNKLKNLDRFLAEDYLLEDPLNSWFSLETIWAIRKIEAEIQNEFSFQRSEEHYYLEDMSQEMAFFYVGIFRLLKELASPFSSSNPTWIKVPKNKEEREHYPIVTVVSKYMKEMTALLSKLKESNFVMENMEGGEVELGITSSHNLPLPDHTIDCIITSPPYCTRIDYPIMTRLELAFLYITDEEFTWLRRQMIGSPLMNSGEIEQDLKWGETCLLTLNQIKNHSSKASESYYYRTYVQYFSGIYKSFKELDRVLKLGGKAAFVVQNSFYKDIYVNLAEIFIEIAKSFEWKVQDLFEYTTRQSMVHLNTRSKKYRNSNEEIEKEVVLIFEKGC